ncbi:MAG: calcium-binding protein [Solirubrobacteraceae bacterium]
MRAAVLAALATALAAPAAGAATVQVGATGAVDYAAAPGEDNALRVSARGTTVTISDPGAVIGAGPGCAATSATRATCVSGGLPAVSAALGDGDDRAVVAGAVSAVLDGGGGNDVLTGGDVHDVLEGDGGDDVLRGGAGDDALFGDGPGLTPGGGDDRLAGGPGADAVDCGPGADVVVDAEPADATTGCERSATTAAPAALPLPASAQQAASPLDPGVIVVLKGP